MILSHISSLVANPKQRNCCFTAGEAPFARLFPEHQNTESQAVPAMLPTHPNSRFCLKVRIHCLISRRLSSLGPQRIAPRRRRSTSRAWLVSAASSGFVVVMPIGRPSTSNCNLARTRLWSLQTNIPTRGLSSAVWIRNVLPEQPHFPLGKSPVTSRIQAVFTQHGCVLSLNISRRIGFFTSSLRLSMSL